MTKEDGGGAPQFLLLQKRGIPHFSNVDFLRISQQMTHYLLFMWGDGGVTSLFIVAI